MEQGENAANHHFLLVPPEFQTIFYHKNSKLCGDLIQKTSKQSMLQTNHDKTTYIVDNIFKQGIPAMAIF